MLFFFLSFQFYIWLFNYEICVKRYLRNLNVISCMYVYLLWEAKVVAAYSNGFLSPTDRPAHTKVLVYHICERPTIFILEFIEFDFAVIVEWKFICTWFRLAEVFFDSVNYTCVVILITWKKRKGANINCSRGITALPSTLCLEQIHDLFPRSVCSI